jgi:serine/threonine protein phosphatase 1
MSRIRQAIQAIKGGRHSAAATDGIRSHAIAEPDALFVVGDVHGQLALYRRLEDHILAQVAAAGWESTVIALVGDVIDRGPDSAGMVEHLLSRPPDGVQRLSVLGNHEKMAAEFLERPCLASPWLANGGDSTLASYGILSIAPCTGEYSTRRLAQMIQARIPPAHRVLFNALPHILRIGRHVVTHAGIAQERALDDQDVHDLLWLRRFPPQDPTTPPDGLGEGYVIQGHVVLDRPARHGWAINVDTGAYASGRLSAVQLMPGRPPAFLTMSPAGLVELVKDGI